MAEANNPAAAGGVINILWLNSAAEDWQSLSTILEHHERDLCPGMEWSLIAGSTWSSAEKVMGEEGIPVVLCESEPGPQSGPAGTAAGWRELLDLIRELPNPPVLIVTSRLADDRLWAEALNLGAYDVLSEPFNETEVVRTVTRAWEHWNSTRKPISSATREHTSDESAA
jgi:DNA-binding NtrC family response regulator